MIVIIDNYDSFVFNIARYFHKLGEATEVIRNDAISVSDLVGFKARAVVISPGPCTPTEAGISTAVVRELSGSVPNPGHLPGTSVYRERFRRTREACASSYARSVLVHRA